MLLSGVFEQVYLQEMKDFIGRILRAAGSQVDDSRLHVLAANTLKVVAAEEPRVWRSLEQEGVDPTAGSLPNGYWALDF